MIVPFIRKKLLLRGWPIRPNAPFPGGLADYITVHMTGNRSPGADAEAHANWAYASAPYSWHLTNDDREVWQHLLLTEQGFHAGDGAGPGNTTSIALEICMNADIDQVAAYELGVKVVRYLLALGHGKQGVVQHNHWTGKNCPELIRAEPGRWEWFLEQVYKEEDDMPDPRIDELIAAFGGIETIRAWNRNGNSLLAGYGIEQADQDTLEGRIASVEQALVLAAAGGEGGIPEHEHEGGPVRRP